MSNLLNHKLIKVYSKRAAVIADPPAVSMPWDNPAVVDYASRLGRANPDAKITPELAYGNLENMSKAQGKNVYQYLDDSIMNEELNRQVNMKEGPAASSAAMAGARERAARRVVTESVNPDGSGKVEVTPTVDEHAAKIKADKEQADKEQTPEWQAAQKQHERKLFIQSILRSIKSPTDSASLNYGIHGGVGALIGGGLGALFSGSKNRWRNALLMALLGGGIGVGGSYLANRPEAPMELPKA